MIHGYYDVQALERRKIGETERGQSANQTTRGGKEKGSRSCYTFLEPVLSIVVADIAADAPISSTDHVVVDVPIAGLLLSDLPWVKIVIVPINHLFLPRQSPYRLYIPDFFL